MNTRRSIYIFLGALFVIFLVVLVFVIIFRNGDNGGNGTVKTVVLADNAADDDVKVSYTLDGIIRGNELHRAIRISVNNRFRTLEVFEDYQGTVIDKHTFPNNVESFRAFLAGLQTLGYLRQASEPAITDFEGQCPLGYRHIFNTEGVENAPTTLWRTSCSNTSGNFRGSLDSVRRLFRLQIPKYDSLVSRVNL